MILETYKCSYSCFGVVIKINGSVHTKYLHYAIQISFQDGAWSTDYGEVNLSRIRLGILEFGIKAIMPKT